MGLDAYVYCACFELGRLREPPPVSVEIRVAANGKLEWETDDPLVDLALDFWLSDLACDHAGGILTGHRIGNIGLVRMLRDELSRSKELFPVLLETVLYSGAHCGDYLPTGELLKLREEVERLEGFTCSDPEYQHYMDEFREEMEDLVESALAVDKPICF
jgi:hypothetical protein